jgi:glycosyltransferase involved in cell wall biosynthesis
MTAKIRVLELTAGVAIGAPLGGAARFVVELTRALNQPDNDLGIEPFLASIWRYGTSAETNWLAILNQESIPSSFAANWNPNQPVMSCVDGLTKLWRSCAFTPDIIHSHGEFTDIAAVLLKRRLGARYLVRTRHSTIEWPKRPALGRIFGHWLYPALFDVEVAVSKRSAVALNERLLARWRKRKSTTIYNAIDFGRFEAAQTHRPASRQALHLSEQTLVLGTIGALVAKKGVDTLLHALSMIVCEMEDAKLLIVGDGPDRARLEKLAAELNIGEHVIFLGAQAHIEKIIPAFDLYLSGSLVEGLPTVLLESVAAGVPVIATDIPGNNEVITNGVTGRLVPPQAPQAMADAIKEARQNADLTSQMAQRALLDIRSRFDIHNIAAQYAALFQRLMHSCSGRTDELPGSV